MKSEWRTVALGSVADLTVGFVGTMASNYTETGIPFLRSTNIEPFDIKLDNRPHRNPRGICCNTGWRESMELFRFGDCSSP